MRRQDQDFIYKNHRCIIEHDYEDDCVKAFHFCTLPDGKKVWADITPYDSSTVTFKLWIDAGKPKRISCGPLHREDLEKMLQSRLDMAIGE